MDPSQLANALYYTFSTLAQAMAAALGLIGAIAIFRISRLHEIVDDSTGYLYRKSLTLRLMRAVHEENHDQILEEWSRQTDEATNPGADLERNESLFKKRLYEESLRHIREIKASLKETVIKTGSVVLYSVVAMFLTPAYHHQPLAVYAVMGLGLGGILLSGWSLWGLVKRCV